MSWAEICLRRRSVKLSAHWYAAIPQSLTPNDNQVQNIVALLLSQAIIDTDMHSGMWMSDEIHLFI